MKKIALVAALAALTAATPALAQNANFVGAHADITAGFNDVKHHHDGNDVNYAAAVGIDAPLGNHAIVGVEATADNVFDSDRQYGVAGRVGFALTPNLLAYGKVGYENWHDVYNHNLDGIRYGGGAQLAMTPHTYLKAEYRRTDYEGPAHSDGVLGGIGIRF